MNILLIKRIFGSHNTTRGLSVAAIGRIRLALNSLISDQEFRDETKTILEEYDKRFIEILKEEGAIF